MSINLAIILIFAPSATTLLIHETILLMIHPNGEIMRELIAYAIKNSGKQFQPTGCFIVKGNKIVSRGVSSTQKSHDTTAHAEINAMRKLSKSRKNNNLKGYWIYSTQMPCPMCASAIVWSDAEGIVYGWSGKHGWIDVYFRNFNVRKIINIAKRKKSKIHGPFLQYECMNIRGYGKKLGII